MGEATGEPEAFRRRVEISIHASRGGSDFGLPDMEREWSLISIHASRGGSDALGLCLFEARLEFQSTLPVGEATKRPPLVFDVIVISIHASRGGSDQASSEIASLSMHFNPRFPWGKRLPAPAGRKILFRFQSTLPVGEATARRRPKRG